MNDSPSFGGMNDPSCHETRIVFLGDLELNHEVSTRNLVDRILRMNAEDTVSPITLVINSGGGSVSLMTALLDVINAIDAPVYSQVFGMAASCACVTAACMAKGQRYIAPLARVMMHEPWTYGGGGDTTQLKIEAAEIEKSRDMVYMLMAKATNRKSASKIKRLQADMSRDFWMGAEEAVAYGLADHIGVCETLTSGLVQMASAGQSGAIQIPLQALLGGMMSHGRRSFAYPSFQTVQGKP